MKHSLAAALLACVLAGAAPGALAQAPSTAPTQAKTAVATFAGGCFWCTEADFDKVAGVVSTVSGYIGGQVKDPTYAQVSAGRTGHTEAVEIRYDPTKVSYQQLLEVFWKSIDPLVKNRQFCDVGSQYRTGIFYHDDEQRKLAEASKVAVEAQLKRKVETEITAAGPFYRAEEYHQDFHLKNAAKYNFYRWNCGRDRRLKEIWGTG